jgi:hypothetical protein
LGYSEAELKISFIANNLRIIVLKRIKKIIVALLSLMDRAMRSMAFFNPKDEFWLKVAFTCVIGCLTFVHIIADKGLQNEVNTSRVVNEVLYELKKTGSNINEINCKPDNPIYVKCKEAKLKTKIYNSISGLLVIYYLFLLIIVVSLFFFACKCIFIKEESFKKATNKKFIPFNRKKT